MSELIPYRIVDPETIDACETYSALVGPDGFECVLTEPEDRTWLRDGLAVVDRLNSQHEEISRLKSASRPSPWISVEDRLPDPETRTVLVAYGDGYVEELFSATVDELVRLGLQDEERVTHWMPLPEPPK